MKYIFPQNYNFKTKFLGLVDYSTAIFNVVCWIIIFLITKLFNFNLITTFTFFIVTCFPILLVSTFGFHQENIIYVFRYIFVYLKSNKIYLYKK